MIDRILDLYREYVSHAVVVVNPAFAGEVVRHLDARGDRIAIHCVEQRSPTGMLDAILLAAPHLTAANPDSVWITWCDQVAVQPATLDALARDTETGSHAAVVMPTIRRSAPYIHFERNASGRIVRVLHRREGDAMPAVGENDIGVFGLSPESYGVLLPRYAHEVEIGGATGERNFLPFIPWVARTRDVLTFPCTDPMEAIGVNTPEELKQVEEYLTRRA